MQLQASVNLDSNSLRATVTLTDVTRADSSINEATIQTFGPANIQQMNAQEVLNPRMYGEEDDETLVMNEELVPEDIVEEENIQVIMLE